MKIKVIGALSPTHLACQAGDKFFARTADPRRGCVDEPMNSTGCSPEMMKAALLTKWGFSPVVDARGRPDPEIDDSEYPIIARTKLKGGWEGWVIKKVIPKE